MTSGWSIYKLCCICDYLLFVEPFKNLNLISNHYSNITFWSALWDYQYSNKWHVYTNIVCTGMVSVSTSAVFWSLQSRIFNCYHDSLIIHIFVSLIQCRYLRKYQIELVAIYIRSFLLSCLHSQQGHSAGLFQAFWHAGCPLPCLGPMINHLPPVCRSIFLQIYSKEIDR